MEGKTLKSVLEEFYIFEKVHHVFLKIGEEFLRQDYLPALHFFSELSLLFYL